MDGHRADEYGAAVGAAGGSTGDGPVSRRRSGEEVRVLSLTAILGYGYPEESFRRALEADPDVIAVDAGSTDPGPYYLGHGVPFTSTAAVRRDLLPAVRAAKERGIPLIIGSAGGSGAAPHLARDWAVLTDIARSEGLHLKVAVIQADIPARLVEDALAAGQITPLGPTPPLTRRDLEDTTYIVGQMGVEPFLAALDLHPDIILAGRAYDPAMFAAVPIRRGLPKGLALHMGKILECGAIAASPGAGSDCLLGAIRPDSFRVWPPNPERRCTVTSVAGHTLYEKSDPYHLPGPGGELDLEGVEFRALDSRTVEVRGSRFRPAERYTVKLEGARLVGYRTLSIAGVRDPMMIRQIDSILEAVRQRGRQNFREVDPSQYRLLFHIYGKDGVMQEWEPRPQPEGHELGLVIETVASTQELADTITGFVRSTLLHYGYPGRMATAGNLAFPYSPSDLHAGEVYEFTLNHLLPVADPLSLFPVELREL